MSVEASIHRLRMTHRPGDDALATAVALLRARVGDDFDAMTDVVEGFDEGDDQRGICIFLTMVGGLALITAEGPDGAEKVLDVLAGLSRGERL